LTSAVNIAKLPRADKVTYLVDVEHSAHSDIFPSLPLLNCKKLTNTIPDSVT